MKATGIVRRIDDLGRVVIPKEIRRTMRIREGDPLEIYTDTDGQVIFKKYSPMGELSEFAVQICDALHKTTGEIAAVCDRDTVIAVAGGGKRELLERRVSRELEELMTARGQYAADTCTLPVTETDERYAVAVAHPLRGGCARLRAVCRRARRRPRRRNRAQARAGGRRLSRQADGELKATESRKRPPGKPGGLSLCVQPLRALYAAGAP